MCEFFGSEVAAKLASEGSTRDVIHAHNVLAHVADLNGVVKGFATLLAPGGVAIVEAPYVKELIDRTEFDTIYHEHLCYFSLTALDALFRRHGLTIVDVENVADSRRHAADLRHAEQRASAGVRVRASAARGGSGVGSVRARRRIATSATM